MDRLFRNGIQLGILTAILLLGNGCAAFRPIPGVPARYLAPELRATSRANESTIDLSLLAQNPPPQHLVDAGDVLGLYIEGVLGNVGEAPPISVPTTPDLPPSIGYPITVRDDGTISLPMIGSLTVRGYTIRQVEEKIRHIYTIEYKYLKPGQDRIIVSLQRPRQIRVLVLRQESGGPGGTEFAQGLSINLGQTKRGNGQAVDLPIYKNDVLHALARTGGLPGLDAENTIYIIRRPDRPGLAMPQLQPTLATPFIPAGHAPQYNPAPSPVAGPVTSRHRSAEGIQLVGHEVFTAEHAEPSLLNIQTREYAVEHQAPVVQAIYPTPGQPVETYYRQPIEMVNDQKYRLSGPLEELRSGMHRGAAEPYGMPVQSIEYQVQQPPPLLSAPSLTDLPVDNPVTTMMAPEQYLPGNSQQQLTQPHYSQQQLTQPHYSQQQLTQPHYSQQQLAPSYTNDRYLSPQQGYAGNLSVGQSPVYQPPVYPSQAPMLQPGPVSPGFGYLPPAPQPADQLLPMYGLPFDPNQLLGIDDPTVNNTQIIKIPVRLKPGEQPHIRPEDIILQEGDIVFIESRETEIFYTGGLLGGGQYTLPRDYDLDVLGAIAIAQGTNQQQSNRQLGGVSAINGDVTISASDVIILRSLPNGSQVPIKVDLYRAIRDPAERVLIQPGDIVMLRYKRLEAVGAFIERNLLESALFGIAAATIPTGGGGGGN